MGVSIPDAAMIFTRSQLLVVDEVKRYWRVCGLDFSDFLEALCRIATLVSAPAARPSRSRLPLVQVITCSVRVGQPGRSLYVHATTFLFRLNRH